MMNILIMNGKENPVWMSQNRYNNGHIVVEKYFVELEGKNNTMDGQRDIHADLLRLVEWVEQHGLQMVVLHSGNKSFHCHIHLKDEVGTAGQYNRVYAAIGNGMKANVRIKTIDMKCCEPCRLHRVPLTNKGGQKACIPIPVRLFSDLKGIFDLLEHPRVTYGTYRTKGKEVPVEDLCKLTGGKALAEAPEKPSYEFTSMLPTEGFGVFLDNILMQKCVLNDLLSVHPEHETRLALIGWLNYLDYSEEEAVQFCDKLATHAQWDDGANKSKRDYYVRHAIRKKYSPHSCHKLRQKLRCIEKNCPLYEG
jgi:hypothetical protein